ncbi:hypothetical protein PG993_007305 [Apiospora rasikravindrae]|uniref:Protamine P1 n=1 Tax=Apiospora rasikravindrae TaxID=990691 RepID=A0ABR1SX48_9PEZI
MDMDWWEQAQPREEPLHCAAPQSPEDVLYLGTAVSQGETTSIIFGIPAGPFEKSSGWQNPWLPNNGTLPPSSLRPTITKPAVKASIRRNIPKLEGKVDSTPDTRGSMQCHLPSPESNRDLQLDDYDSLDPDKRSRIQSWAKNVTTGALEKDSFWAPVQAKVQTPDNATNKRPAGNNWLKSKLSKRSKSDHPSSSSLMTPTPVIPSEPIRKTSPPAFAVSQKASDMSQQPPLPESDIIANTSGSAQGMAQSVEEYPQATAESSYPGLEQPRAPHSFTKDLNPMSLIPTHANVPDQLPASNDIFSETSSELSSLRSSQVTPAYPIRDIVQTGDLPNLETADTFHETIDDAAASGDSHTEEADSTFESHLDQSFHYKTRPSRKDATRPVTAEPAAVIPLSQPTQTGTPVSENHQDSVTFKAGQTLKDDIDTISPGRDSSISVSVRDPQSSIKAPSVVDNEETKGQRKVEPRPSSSIIFPSMVNADAVCSHPTQQGDRPNSKDSETCLAPNHDIANLDQPKLLPTREDILMSKAPCSKRSFSSTVVDGDTTLVVDAMDVDRQLNNASFFHPPERLDMVKYAEGAPLLASLAARASSPVDSRKESVEKPVSTNSPISLEGEKRGMINNASPGHEYDGEETAVHIPLSQMEWGIGERETHSLTCSSSAAIEQARPPFSSEAIENKAENIYQMLDNNMQQELLTMEAQPDAADTILHIKTEPGEEVPTLAVYNASMPGPSSIVLDRSVLRPSQQSPWGMVDDDAPLVKNEFQATNSAVPQPDFGTLPNSTSQLPSQQQSPWGVIDTRTPIRPYGSIPVSSLLNVTPQWPSRSQSEDLHPSDSLRSHVSFASQPSDTPSSFLHGRVSSSPLETPQAAQRREETPEPELSVKSFAKFNTPSPERRPRGYKHPRLSGSRLPSTQVLVDATDGNPWGTQGTRSNRHVSFAPLPCEEKDAANTATPQAPRPASPPPAITPRADDDDTDHRFWKHFDAVKSRGGYPSKVGTQERLLPSESQQRPMSPDVGAMAEAFREADTFHIPNLLEPRASSTYEDEDALPVGSYQKDEPAIDAPQSPWREESQGLDAVAEVMQNLDDFLNPQWGEESDLGMAL